MKPNRFRHRAGGLLASLFLVGTSGSPAVTVDGVLGGSEGYTQDSVQTITSGWGGNNTLASLNTVQEDTELAVFLGGRCDGNAIFLFIDSKAGGVSFIPNNLITSGDEDYTINRMGTSDSAGLTFESGFEPDFAIRIYGDTSNAYVRRFNLQTGVSTYVGESVNSAPAASGLVHEVRTTWAEVTGPASGVINGVELRLGIAELGVPFGTGQPVKLMALLVNNDSTYGSNQVLGAKTGTDDIGGNPGVALTPYDFEADAAVQTISITVDNNDTDGDGLTNDIDDDDDDDFLLDTEETNTGIFVSDTETGSDPLVYDTDGDGAWDGDEVLFDYFGFQTDPNKPNFASMAVPGSFTTPEWQVDGSADNEMTMPDQSFAGQFDWELDYEFDDLGSFEYKFAADGSYTNSWGDGGGNITSSVTATGIHTFTFNNDTLARSFTRKTFDNVGDFLAAYGLSAGVDDDLDTILNEDEFAGNTDPTNADTDGDGVNDDVDANPLVASRDIEFSVDMTVQETLGNFDPGTGSVVVKFFTGLATGQPDLALTEVGDTGVYSGTLTAFEGPVGADFGGYKFFNTTPGAPNGGYEEGFDRNFTLGAANTTQTLATVFFSDVSSLPGYSAWADANAGGQTPDLDFDLDGTPNGVEYFMGEAGSAFTANPQLGSGTVTWPRDASANATFRVWISTNLTDWTDVTGDADTSNPDQVSYTPPTPGPLFVRLEVVIP